MSGTNGNNDYQNGQAQDTVGVFDADFNQLFMNARPMGVKVSEKAKIPKHPVESGATKSDFRVIEPITIDIQFVLRADSFLDTYNEMLSVFTGKNLVSIQTMTGQYDNMMLSAMPHDESPAHIDTIFANVKFEEFLLATSSSSPMPASATTQKGGHKTGKQASKTESTAASVEANNQEGGSAAYSWLYGGKK